MERILNQGKQEMVGGMAPEAALQPIMDSVPGVERVPDIAALPDTIEPALGERGNPVVVENSGFMGDPSRVIGHPSNPNSAMTQAIAESLTSVQTPPSAGQ